jgi:phosphonate transport system substrate-binding protein
MLIGSLSCCQADATPREARMVMGVYSKNITEMASRSDLEVALNFWVKDLLAEEAERIKIHFTESRAISFDNINEMRNAMLRGELDLVVAPPLLLSKYFKRSELADGFTAMLEDNKPDSLLLIARNDKNIHGVKDLQAKKLLMPSDDEMADVFLDSLFLKQFSTSYKNIVASAEQQNKASRIVLDVFFKKVDAGIVYRDAYDVMVELNPEISKNIIILEQYPIKSKNFSFFTAGYPYSQDLSDMIVAAVSNGNSRVKQLLDVFKMPVLVSCSVTELDEFARFYADYLTSKNRQKK